MKALRYAWALPASLPGLLLALLAYRRGHVHVVDGVLEAHGPLLARILSTAVPLPGGADAITFGHVVLARDACSLEVTRAHERVHVRQYERWGIFFFPAYLLASGYAAWTGGDYYRDNLFERQAVDDSCPEISLKRRVVS